MKIRIQRISAQAALPEYAHGPDEDAGMDLRAVDRATLIPGIPLAVSTGLTIELPPGYEAQVRPRSGLALKHAITVPNAPATIDPGYGGEIGTKHQRLPVRRKFRERRESAEARNLLEPRAIHVDQEQFELAAVAIVLIRREEDLLAIRRKRRRKAGAPEVGDLPRMLSV